MKNVREMRDVELEEVLKGMYSEKEKQRVRDEILIRILRTIR